MDLDWGWSVPEREEPEVLLRLFLRSWRLMNYLGLIKLSDAGDHLILRHLVCSLHLQDALLDRLVLFRKLLELDLCLTWTHNQNQVGIA
jgi:hypothetical protein